MRVVSTVVTTKPSEQSTAVDMGRSQVVESTPHKNETNTAVKPAAEQKDFAKMVNDQVEKQDINATKKNEKPVSKKIGVNLSIEGQQIPIGDKKESGKASNIIAKRTGKQGEVATNKKLEEIGIAEQAGVSEIGQNVEETGTIAIETISLVLPMTTMAEKKADKSKDSFSDDEGVVVELTEVSIKSGETDTNVALAELSNLDTKNTVVDKGEGSSSSINATAVTEKADIQNVNQADSQMREPVVLVSDRRVQAAGDDAKPVEPSVLIRQALRETGNAEIVNRAQFILKEQGAGEIRLTLKPESLGTVRINLSLDDNRVLGRIIVDSPEVKAAFDDNMADLRERMLKSGFAMGDLDVSVGQRNQGQGEGQNGQEDQPFFSDRYREGNKVFNQIQEAPRVDSYRSVLVDMKA